MFVEAVQAIRHLCLAVPVTQVSSWNAVRDNGTKWAAKVWLQAIEALGAFWLWLVFLSNNHRDKWQEKMGLPFPQPAKA